MNIDKISLDLPAKLEEIFQFSFNFDGLKKIIEYFQKNNNILATFINDFDKRITLFESFKSDIDDIKIKSVSIEKSNDEINKSLLNMQQKMISLESKLNEISRTTEENCETIKKHTNMIYKHEENIKKITKNLDEHNELIKELKDNYDIMKKKIDINDTKINELENKSEEAFNLIKDNSETIAREKLEMNQQIENINSNLNNLTTTYYTMKKITEMKNKEYDKYINDILKNNYKYSYNKKSALNSLEFAFMDGKEKKDVDNDNDNNDQMSNNDGENNFNKTYKSFDFKKDKNYDKFYEELKKNEKKTEEENNKNKKVIKEIQNNIDNMNVKIKNLLNDNYINMNNKDSDNKLADIYKKVTDNIKLLSIAINTKPDREDLEALKRNLEIRLKKLELINNNPHELKKVDSNAEPIEKKEVITSIENKSFDYIIEKIQSSINDNISSLVEDIINKNGRNIDLSNNSVILDLIRNNQNSFDEINQKILSLSDNKSKISKDIEERVDMLNEQVLKLYENNNINNIKIGEVIREIEGSDNEEEDLEDNKKNKLNEGTIKERLCRLSNLYYEIKDRAVMLEKKNNSFNREIKEDVKSHLKIETTKIVDQFKNKLSIFTHKFEDELNNKIDQIGLYSFEKKINSKLYYELKDKLNKNELKKNNNLLNRKIDSLENKISKTLVDTIIDLQMDEAPLLLKKNNKNLEVCASCNQLLQRNNSINSDISMSPNKSHINKYKSKIGKFNGVNSQTQTLNLKTSLSTPKFLPEINTNNFNDK